MNIESHIFHKPIWQSKSPLFKFAIYIYIYLISQICNLSITDTFFNYQNIQGLFLFSNLSPLLTLIYHIYLFPFPYIFFIFIYVLFLSLKTNKFSICDGKFLITTTCLFLISTIKGTSLSLSLSHLDFSMILIFYLF